MTTSRTRPRVLLLDVNETLLDMAPVRQEIDDLLPQGGSSTLWFAMTLHYSLVMSASGRHAAFTDIGAATLRMLARNSDIALSEDDAKQLLGKMTALQPHPDVAPALDRLCKAGFRLATLTNSSQSGVQAQLQHASLTKFFERQLSVETSKLFKPHREVYLWAAREMRSAPSECMLVAAHGWDVAGAKWAGLQTAFVARQEQQLFPLGDRPDLDAADLEAIADALID